MILVTGATGYLGRVVIEHLLKRRDPGEVAAFVRDAGKAADLEARGVDVRVGDYDDVGSLERAMRGVEKVLLISGTDRDEERGLRQHRNVVDAAGRAGVRFIAYTGRAIRDPGALENALMVRHFKTEDLIRGSGLTYALFRNALYFETLIYYIGKPGGTFETDIRLPAGRGRVAYALRSDLGEAIANALHRDDGGEDRVYTLTAGEAWSFDDVARGLGELSGKPVTYTPTDQATYEAEMQASGVPGPMARFLYGFYCDIRDGQVDEVTPELEGLLGRKPASLEAGLRAVFNLRAPDTDPEPGGQARDRTTGRE